MLTSALPMMTYCMINLTGQKVTSWLRFNQNWQ